MTAARQIYAGSRITASMIANVAPLAVIKGADQDVTSSTTLQADDALFLNVLANAGYLFKATLFYEGGTQGSSDLKWQWTVPSGAQLWYTDANDTLAGAASVGTAWSQSSVPTAGTNGSGNRYAVKMTGTLVTASTAGILQLLWAQNASNGTPTIVHAGSVVELWQVQ